jgi:hypothetical protein
MVTEESLKALEPGKFKPGVSGNPAGKKKGSIDMSKRIRKILALPIDWEKININDDGLKRLKKRYGNASIAECLIYIQVSKAMTGDTQAFRVLSEGGWGKMINLGGGAKLDVVHIYKPEKLEEAQLETAAQQLRERARQAVEGEVIDETIE